MAESPPERGFFEAGARRSSNWGRTGQDGGVDPGEVHTVGMAVMSADAQPTVAEVRRRPGLALLAALLCATPYALGVALPYYAHGVHRRPAGETLYAYDLATLWPYDTALGGVVAFVTVVGLPTAPFVATGVALWSGVTVWAAWRTLSRRQVGLYVAAAVVALAALAWLLSPPAIELVVWFYD
ncbi:hypothetical protein GCM10023339_05080 [Alloalcanivorax gelatiniphagus]